MKTIDIANKLADLCRHGKNLDALNLYAADAVSVEAGAPPGQDAVSRGLDAIRAKGQWWFDNHTVPAMKVNGPWPHGDRFIVSFDIDVTNKPSGQRMQMSEAGLYTVKDGKIVREEFFYHMG